MYINYQHRVFGLDLIRSIAILLVLFSHSTLLLFPEKNSTVLTAIRFFGTIGVDLFFVLSGFLIGGLILKQLKVGKTAFKDFMYFWVRRWFRTLPNYFLILILNVIIFYILYQIVIDDIGYFFVFLQNFANPHPDFFTEAWSLSVEEYAYIIGPLILYFLLIVRKNHSRNKLFLWMIFLIIAYITLFRLIYHFNHVSDSVEIWSQGIRKVVIYRIDSIYYGFIGAYIAVNFSMYWKKYKMLLFNLGIIIFVAMHAYIYAYNIIPDTFLTFYNIFYLPLVSISLLLLFPLFSNWQNGTFLKYPITYISILSYGVYLINYSLVLLTIKYFIDIENESFFIKLAILALYWILSFSLAHVLYRFFEKPCTDLRDSRFIKSKFE